MGRAVVKSRGWWAVAVGVGILVWGPSLSAQKKDAKKAAAEQEEETRESGYPPNHYKNYTKIRPGSLVHREEPEEPEPRPEVRGEYELRRDHEVIVHFRRLAELDAIIDLARENDEAGLVDRAESVRRLEEERFRLAMNRLRTVLNAKRVRGLP